MTSRTLAPALVGALLAAPLAAWADPPVALRVNPIEGRAAWELRLVNVSSQPVTLAADRHLLWFELPPPPPPPNAGRRRRAPAPVRCSFEAQPSSNLHLPEVTLRPGEVYRERVDLADLCRLRIPTAAVPGAVVTAHYGMRPRPARRGRPVAPSASRSVVFEPVGAPVEDLSVAATLPSVRPSTAPEAGTWALSGTSASAARGAGLRVRVTLRNTSGRARTSLYRTSLFSFTLQGPDGARTECNALTRPLNPLREFVVTVGAGRARGATLLPAVYCPRTAFDRAGVYSAVVVFDAPGEDLGARAVQPARARSAPFFLRITRGDGRVRPLDLFVGRDEEAPRL